MKMNKLLTILIIAFGLCTSSVYAEWRQCSNTNPIPALVGTNDISGLFSVSTDKLTPDQSNAVKKVTSSKVPTRGAARKILAERSESVRWMAVDYSRMDDRGLRSLNRGVEGFGKQGDYIWVIEVKMLRFSEVFMVNTENGELLELIR